MYKILANTIFLGKDVHFLPDCHSTNDIALQMIRKSQAKEGTIIITGHQTKGKGQRGNSWFSEPGKNLTLSMVLAPEFLDISEQFHLNMCIAVGIRSFLEEYIPNVKVKWPNDIVVPGFGKIGGVLIENILTGPSWEYAVVGIGLNVNQISFANPKATSMAKISQNIFDLNELFRMLITRLEKSYLKLKKSKYEDIKNEYLSHMYLMKQRALYLSEGIEFEGEIVGINDSGKLQIKEKEGMLREFDLKEVAFLE
ncbi:biotin--[acetyl-CoA-carboxylase] ligase [Algoriphagus aestuarii]|nr:biotin--[acetyl-CoA-carboxylase] ligase [Algoriphagus aestuarii]